MAEEAQQPRQLTQGVQRHLHGGNENDEPWPETLGMCGRRLRMEGKPRSIHSQKSVVSHQLRRACRLVGWGVVAFLRGFRGEFKNWHIILGLCESLPVMENLCYDMALRQLLLGFLQVELQSAANDDSTHVLCFALLRLLRWIIRLHSTMAP